MFLSSGLPPQPPGLLGQRHLHHGDERGEPGRAGGAEGARQDPAVQRIRLHHGHAQEGRGLHQEGRGAEPPRRQEGGHANVEIVFKFLYLSLEL